MGWETEFFGINGKADKKESNEKKTVKCATCNSIIGIVSTTIYEIDQKQYCSACYSQKIIKAAVERDHSDLQREKIAVPQ